MNNTSHEKNEAANKIGSGLNLLTVSDVAEFLQISERGVWRLASTSKFPKPMKVGRLARWTLKSIECWIESGCN